MRTPEQALAHWQHCGRIDPAPDAGLINRTFWVRADRGRADRGRADRGRADGPRAGGTRVDGPADEPTAVLQWVNPIFSPQIHHDIQALSARLKDQNVLTPELIATRNGSLWLTDAPGCWRLWTFLPGRTFHQLTGAAQAAAAGELVGRFHRALAAWDYVMKAPPRNIHDTPQRMADLKTALETADRHPLAEPARQLGSAILARWQGWEGELDLPARPCHGDLKISNLRFSADGVRALALLDLDTLERMPLASELGDAWRSWCNPAGEDRPQAATFDLDRFSASARAWFAAGPELDRKERCSLVPGIERISLELAARFCADAVLNSYFREDRQHFAQPGEHNLIRATAQFAVATACRQGRRACEAMIANL